MRQTSNVIAEGGDGGKTHNAGVGIALEPAVAAAIEAGVWSVSRAEVAFPASLKSRARARESEGCILARASRSQEEDANPDSSRLPVVRDSKLSGSERGRLPPIQT